MKKGPLILIIIIILVAGYLFLNKNASAPVDTPEDSNSMEGTMPALGEPGSNPDDLNGNPSDLANQSGPAPLGGATGSSIDPNLVTFNVEGGNFYFAPRTMTVKKGSTVQVNFTNKDGFHDLVIDEFAGAKTPQLKDGEKASITFVADKAGTFEYYCSVGTHRQMGMKGTLIVTE